MYDRFQWRHLCWQDHARVDGEHCDLILVDGSPERNNEYLMFQVKSESNINNYEFTYNIASVQDD